VIVSLRVIRRLAALGWLVLAGCSSGPQYKPVDIPQVPVVQEVKQVWTLALGAVPVTLVPAVLANQVVVTNDRGELQGVDLNAGRALWRVSLNERISAGVGSDGQRHAVVTTGNELVVVQDAKVLWRYRLPAQAFTAPLVAGQRVFVLLADRSVLGFDGATGRLLWTQQRPGDPLVLKQAGVLTPVGDTLVAGLSGRLVGLNPTTGALRWDAPIATPRGTNDLERLVDVVGPLSRQGDELCARAYQAQVGCVSALRGQVRWTRTANSDHGVHGNDQLVVGAEANGVVVAWQRSSGERLWQADRLRYRRLSAPLVTPKGIVLTDSGGWAYLLSLTDGALLNRWKTDDTDLAGYPQAFAGGFLLLNRSGRLAAYQFP
jgi:outer membrane protein assembly factor BamB